MGRRTFGSIRELPSGRHQARYRGPDGRTYRGESTFARKADARAWLSTIEADMVRGQWRAPKRVTVTVAEHVAAWIEAQDFKRTTRTEYRNKLRLYIAPPPLGDVRLGDLTADMVRQWQTDLRRTLAAKLAGQRERTEQAGRTISAATSRDGRATAASAYRVLRAALNQAVEDDLISRNPCRMKGAGTVRQVERPVASVDEVLRLAEIVPKRYRCLILLAAFLGPRVGELCALRRRDVEGGQLSIAERLYRLADGVLDYDRPKTEAGTRTVPLGDALEEEVRQHLDQFVAADPDALLFTTRNGTPVIGTYKTWWGRARRKIDRPDLRFHDLRHTGMTLAALSGATQRELMRRMGQSSARAAQLYQHTTDEHAAAVSAQLSALITAHQAGGQVVPLRPVRRRRASG